jgi:hypothetical protein
MREGVQNSQCLLLFLSGRKETGEIPDSAGVYQGLFTRWFCHEEMNAAYAARVKVVGVMETEERHSKPDFCLEKERALTGGRDGGPVHEDRVAVERNLKLMDNHCFIPFRRQEHETGAMLDEVVRQSKQPVGLLGPGPGPEPEPA